MSRYPKWLRLGHHDEDEANIARAIGRDLYDEATGPEITSKTKVYSPAGGDNQRLRGIPAIGPGVTGAIPGTRPGDTLR